MDQTLSSRIYVERTLALIKPDAFDKAEEIEDIILKSGFIILQKRKIKLSPEQVSDFYAHQFGKSNFPSLTALMCSGTTVALTLARSNAVAHWKSIMGPVNNLKARENHPECIRAKYGTSDLENAVHGSESVDEAEREIKFMFPNTVVEQIPMRQTQETEEYLNKFIYPTLLRGLTELCKCKPQNPCIWLADWLADNDPNRPKICEADTVDE